MNILSEDIETNAGPKKWNNLLMPSRKRIFVTTCGQKNKKHGGAAGTYINEKFSFSVREEINQLDKTTELL